MSGREWEEISLEAKDLVQRMLVLNPLLRITTAEVLRHPWILNNTRSELSVQAPQLPPLSAVSVSGGGTPVTPSRNLSSALQQLSAHLHQTKTDKLQPEPTTHPRAGENSTSPAKAATLTLSAQEVLSSAENDARVTTPTPRSRNSQITTNKSALTAKYLKTALSFSSSFNSGGKSPGARRASTGSLRPAQNNVTAGSSGVIGSVNLLQAELNFNEEEFIAIVQKLQVQLSVNNVSLSGETQSSVLTLDLRAVLRETVRLLRDQLQPAGHVRSNAGEVNDEPLLPATFLISLLRAIFNIDDDGSGKLTSYLCTNFNDEMTDGRPPDV